MTIYPFSLDDVWGYFGFTRKDNAKRILCKKFEIDTDFVVVHLLRHVEGTPQRGGLNKENVMLSVPTFKAVWMTVNTEKGKQTRKYYTKMETISFQYMEARNKDIIKQLQHEHSIQMALARHENLRNAHKDTPCVYLVQVSNFSDAVRIIKLGETDDINKCLVSLRQEYKNCILTDVL